jgi:hypothetical protein
MLLPSSFNGASHLEVDTYNRCRKKFDIVLNQVADLTDMSNISAWARQSSIAPTLLQWIRQGAESRALGEAELDLILGHPVTKNLVSDDSVDEIDMTIEESGRLI